MDKEADKGKEDLVDLRLKIPADLYRAYQRCSWVIINNNPTDQLEIMREMVHDFLVKHGC